MGALHRLYQSSLHYDNRYPTSADASEAPQGTPTTHLFPLLPLGHGALPFYRTGWLDCFLFSLFLLSYLMETGAKNKRPQALPRAKESVMIPTLLMNIPEPANNTKSISVVALGFFPQRVSFFVLPVSLFYLLFAAWKKAEEIGLAYTIEDRGRKERKKGKKAPAWHRQTHTRACCGNY
jgi:hypothetical protein